MQKLTMLLLLTALVFTSCQPKTQTEEASSEDQPEMMEEKQYTLTPFSNSYEFANAELQDMSYEDGVFNFDFAGYELGQQTPDADQKMCANSDKGSHIHLILNTQPYAAKYVSEFNYDVPDGDHYLLAFLSRSYHESIKNGKAHIAQKVMVSDKNLTGSEEIEAPMLFYSRPKGTYVGSANTEKVMLDFFLVNADLGGEYKVKAMINGEEHIIDNWQPYYIEGLPMGENRITLTLIDADGNKVDTPLNPVTRKFTLQADPMEEAQ